MIVRAEYRDKNGDNDFDEFDMPDNYSPKQIRAWLDQYVGRWFGMVGIKITIDGEKFE